MAQPCKHPHQTGIDPMLVHCCCKVADAGRTLTQHWVIRHLHITMSVARSLVQWLEHGNKRLLVRTQHLHGPICSQRWPRKPHLISFMRASVFTLGYTKHRLSSL